MIIKTSGEISAILASCKVSDSEMLENESIEFKEYSSIKALHNSKELAGEASALANKNGGVIVVGVRDSSNIDNQDWDSQLVGFEMG